MPYGLMVNALTILMRWWKILGEFFGDGDYSRYREFMRTRNKEREALTAQDFYLARLRDRYSRPSRCC